MASAALPAENEALEQLLCKICCQLPKQKVFMCEKGHSLCASCYENRLDCPDCGSSLDKEDPTRNLFFENEVKKRTGQHAKGIANANVSEDYNCPICFSLPEQEVYQCKNGHCLCASCHNKWLKMIRPKGEVPKCPECIRPFDKVNPIRNFLYEKVMDEYVLKNCPYQVNGCNQRLTRKSLKEHQQECLHNIKRFGKLIEFCKLLGYGCVFLVHNLNTEDAVKHLVTAHGCALTEAKDFQMELTGFQEATQMSSQEICLWNPVILDYKEKKCYLLISAIFNRKVGSLSCSFICIPKYNEPVADLKIQYRVAEQIVDSLEWKLSQSCIPLSKADSFLLRNVPCTILPRNLNSHFTNEGSLLINWILHEDHWNNSNEELGSKLERIAFTKRPTSSNLISLYEFEQSREVVTNSEELFNPQNGLTINANVCVKDLPEFATKEYIKDFFSDFGKVVSVEMIPHTKSTGQGNVSKSCKVSFKHRASVHKVIGRKEPIFMERDGIKHRLVVTAEKLTRITESEEKAYNDKAYEVRTDRYAIMEFIREAFSLTGDWNVRQRLTCWMSFLAAYYGSLESLKYCIEKGIDSNLSQHNPSDNTDRQMSLLILTIQDKNPKSGLEKVKYLVENGADIHFKDDRGASLLFYSVIYGTHEMVKFFLDNGLEVNDCTTLGWTALHAAFLTDVEIRFLVEKVKILLDYGASLNLEDDKGQCPLNLVRLAPVEHRFKITKMFENHLKRALNSN